MAPIKASLDIYSKVGTTQKTTKGGYSRVGAMAAHIDHDFGQAKGLFNNLRLATGQQNLMFKNFVQAAERIDELKGRREKREYRIMYKE